MITQIYGITSAADAIACAEAGGDYLGICVGDHAKNAGTVSVEAAREIYTAVRGRAVLLLIIFHHIEDEQIAIAADLRPNILHLSGGQLTSEAFYSKLRVGAPGVKLMQGIGMTGPEVFDYAVANQNFADYYILDSVRAGGITGAAGVTHDWAISRKIVQAVHIPVVLAGGLGVDNVAASIEAVRPFGVDSFTRTSFLDKTGYPSHKDIGLVREFCGIAHRY